ncbi:MAG: hypothetical protein M3179_09495, partial [Actinomycetota bacterium]|nr:hypothetical protein [Actinomycetota bacterium]
PLPEAPAVPEVKAVHPKRETASSEADAGDLRHEVMFLLEAADDDVPRFKQTWAALGDSIVVTGGDGLWNCHIHTNDIGGAIEAALDVGRPRKIQVTDLTEMVEEERWVRGQLERGGGPAPESPEGGATVTTGVVAVGNGEGVVRILRSLGVHRVVSGGQSMNPSTRDLLEAVEAIAADHVVILPNNRNIIPVAKQVDGLTGKTVRVVETVSVAEGFAALLGYERDADSVRNAQAMSDTAARVVTGEIVRAVRDATSPAGPVQAGDYLGVTREGIAVVAPTPVEAARGLLETLLADEHEVLTIVEGQDVSPADTQAITEWLEGARPEMEIEVHRGDQPLSLYLLSVE